MAGVQHPDALDVAHSRALLKFVTLQHCRLSQNSSDSQGTSPASSALPGRLAHQLPESPFQDSAAPPTQPAAGTGSQLCSADPVSSLDGRAPSGVERSTSTGAAAMQSDSRGLEGRAGGGREAAAAASPQPRRRELRSMSLRPAMQGGSHSPEPSATASALEASPASTSQLLSSTHASACLCPHSPSTGLGRSRAYLVRGQVVWATALDLMVSDRACR